MVFLLAIWLIHIQRIAQQRWRSDVLCVIIGNKLEYSRSLPLISMWYYHENWEHRSSSQSTIDVIECLQSKLYALVEIYRRKFCGSLNSKWCLHDRQWVQGGGSLCWNLNIKFSLYRNYAYERLNMTKENNRYLRVVHFDHQYQFVPIGRCEWVVHYDTF